MSEIDEMPNVVEESETMEEPELVEKPEIVEKSEFSEKPKPSEAEPKSSDAGIGNVVASHYNNLQERGKAARTESRFSIY